MRLRTRKPHEEYFHPDRIQEDEHTISVHELCQRLETDPTKGLTTEAATANRKRFGENVLKPSKSVNLFYRFFVHNFQGADCLACVGVFLAVSHYIVETFANAVDKPEIEKIYVAITLSMFIVYVGIISFAIEWKAGNLLEALHLEISKHSTISVIRDGVKQLINVKELTVGDLVEIQAGDRIAADIRIIEVNYLQVDTSALTKDSAPIMSTVEPTDINPLISKNVLFASTCAVSGECIGIVISIGESTLIGHFERENTLLKQMYTPLIHEFNKLVLLNCGIGAFLSLTFTFLAMRLNYKFLDISNVFITMFIAFVPEKLLVCLHMSHTLAASKMKKKHCLIKHFEGIETLGRCTVICCGKSGILTGNEMKVSKGYCGTGIFDVGHLNEEHFSSDSFGVLIRSMHLNVSRHMKMAAKYGSTSTFTLPIRDKMELAIVKFLQNLNSVQDSELVYTVRFSSARKYQLSIHKVDYDDRFLLVAMGAPEVIFEKCSTILINETESKIDDKLHSEFDLQLGLKEFTGEQIIGFCEVFLPIEKFPPDFNFHQYGGSYPYRGFRFLGFTTFSNPIRPSVPEAVQRCKNAGVRVILMSGDSPNVVEAVARSAGLIEKDNEVNIQEYAHQYWKKPLEFTHSHDKAFMLTGEVLEQLHEDEIKQILYNYKQVLFARIRPHQKIAIIRYLKEAGEIIAVTGKRVGDVSALSRANIALAPTTASGIAKYSSDIILEDGSLTSIVDGIEEGRLVFENFRKSVCYNLATNLPKFFPFFFYMVLGIPLPLGAVAILCIDIGIDFLSAVSLSFEAPEPYFMETPPRKSDNVMSKGLALRAYFHVGVLETCAGMLVYFVVLGLNGFLPDRLVGLVYDWTDEGIDDLEDSYGQQWTYETRKQLEATAHTGYFFAIVVAQVGNLISSRTNVDSIFKHKMNWTLLAILLLEICFGSALASANLGWFDQSLKFREIRWSRVLLMVPFAVLIILYDEIRKWIIRSYPRGWVARHIKYL